MAGQCLVQRDRDEVKHLARSIPLKIETLKERYEIELRWQLGIPEREDLTLKLWIEMSEPLKGTPSAIYCPEVLALPVRRGKVFDGKSSATLVPGVADTEEDAGVVAGIVIAEAGVGVMDQVNAEID